MDELGHAGINGFAWTGTVTGGTAGETCWDGSGLNTAAAGATSLTTYWTFNIIFDCGTANGRIYCFEQ